MIIINSREKAKNNLLKKLVGKMKFINIISLILGMLFGLILGINTKI